jgi:hypothetical protein
LAGLAFPVIIRLLNTLFVTVIDTFLVATIYGFVLWIVTLVPIHKPITGYPVWSHPLVTPQISKSRRSYSLWTLSRSSSDNSYRGLDISILGQYYTDEDVHWASDIGKRILENST